MADTVTTAIIGAAGVVVGTAAGATINAFAQGAFKNFGKTSLKVIGEWDSRWAESSETTHKHSEVITIEKQRGQQFWGVAERPSEPSKKWTIEGRCEGDYIQMFYFPAKTSRDIDFQDYGSYFLKRKASGKYTGFSIGFGPNENNGEDSLSADYHEIERRR